MKSNGEGRSDIPEFLRLWVLKKRLDEKTALRIELVRRAREIDGSLNGGFRPTAVKSVVPNELTFENFVVDLNNVLAVETAKEVVEEADWSETYNPLYLYGERGAGKTHLLAAIANAVRPQEALLVNTSLLLEEYDRTSTLSAKMGLRKWLVSSDLLLLDDIQVCAGRKDFQMEVLSAIAHTISKHRSVVVTSDAPPKSLTDVEPLLVTLLAGGEVVNIGMRKRAEAGKMVKGTDEGPGFAVGTAESSTKQLAVHFTGPKGEDVKRTELRGANGTSVSPAVVGGPRSDSQEITLDPVSQDTVALGTTSGTMPEEITGNAADEFKRMVALAESQEEELRAIESAIAERIRQLREAGGDPEHLERLREASELVKNGKLGEAMDRIAR